MIKDALKSALENLKERTTNPFLGTLILVWLFHNWKLLYSIFNFDARFTLAQRTNLIEAFFKKPNPTFYENLLAVITVTFVILIITYSLLLLARLMTDFYDKIALPYISMLTDKNSIVLRSKYGELQEVVKQLEIRLEQERLAKVAVQNERDTIGQKLYNHLNSNVDARELKSFEPFERIRIKFENENNVDSINSIITDIQSAKVISKDNPYLKSILKEGLVEFKQNDINSPSRAIYILTDEGRKFLRYWNSFHS